ncbi:major facilitator superfamily transporter [Paraphaeosphaeria sporulosa]
MMLAVGMFAIGSAICGGANSGGVLIFGHIVQGLGTGGMDLFAEMIVCDIVPLRRRGPDLAIKHAVFALGTTLGPLLEGVFAEHGWRWRPSVRHHHDHYTFLAARRLRPQDQERQHQRRDQEVDRWEPIVLTESIIMLLVALSTGGASPPWAYSAVVTPLLFNVTGFIGFALYQLSKYCAHPVMPKEVFSNCTTNIAFALTTIYGFVTYGFQFYLPPFFQAVKDSPPTQSGLEGFPQRSLSLFSLPQVAPCFPAGDTTSPFISCMAFGLGLCVMLAKNPPVPAWLMFQLVVAAGSGMVISSMLPAVQVKLWDNITGPSSGF